MYAKGMATRQISDTLEDIYGFEVSECFISHVTDSTINDSVRDNSIIGKPAIYVILGINQDGRKKVMSIEVDENESSKY